MAASISTSSIPSAAGLASAAADTLPGFAPRPFDRFALIEDDDAAGSRCETAFALHFREAPESSDEGKEKSSQANACQRSPEPSDANIFDSE
jgi:hypothetical protein